MFISMLCEVIEQCLELLVLVVISLVEVGWLLDEEQGWFLVLIGLVFVDGDCDGVVEFFLLCGLFMVVVSGVYDEDLCKCVLQQQIIDYVLKNMFGSIDYFVWLVQWFECNWCIVVLVVDDLLLVWMYVVFLLCMYGYDVYEVVDGVEGLKVIEVYLVICLVVVDQEMFGMEGVEFICCLCMLCLCDKVVVIGIFGNIDLLLILCFFKNGVNDFLCKLFLCEEFFCCVLQNVDQLELIGILQDLVMCDFFIGLFNCCCFLEQSQCQLL